MVQEGQASNIPQPLLVAPPPGDPLVLGLGSFVAGATIVGFFLTETLTTGFYFLPVTIGSSFLGLLIATLWAARLGQTFVAAVTGLFMSFWASLGILGFALVHGWFGDPATATDALAAFYWTWGIVIGLLTISALRLPLMFPLLIGGVALTLIILALGTGDAETGLEQLAGYVLWASGLVGVILFLGAGSVSLGGKGMSAGPVLIK
jgi:succinate-acetate transporter protein